MQDWLLGRDWHGDGRVERPLPPFNQRHGRQLRNRIVPVRTVRMHGRRMRLQMLLASD
jgi:hypothetical protein